MKKITALFIGIMLVTACNTTPKSNIQEASPKANEAIPKTIVEKTQVPVGVGAELVLNGTKYLVMQHIQNPNNNYHFRFLANDTEENRKFIKDQTAEYGVGEMLSNQIQCFNGDTWWTWKNETVWFSFWDENDKYLSMIDMGALAEKEIKIAPNGCTKAIGWNGNDELLIKRGGEGVGPDQSVDGPWAGEETWAYNFKNQTFTKFEGK